MAQIDPEGLDKVRKLSAYEFARLLIAILGDTSTEGIKLLGKKTDASFENIKTDDSGRLLVYDTSAAQTKGLVYYGKVTTYTDTTHFKVSGLAGFGNDFFNNFRVYVVRDAGGAGAAPQGEMQPVSDYVSSDGTFVHTAFTTPLAVNDEVLILHQRIAEIGDATYGLAALKTILDAILLDTGTTLEAKLDTIDAVVDAVKTQTDKLAGATPVSSSTTANWNTSTGTSGEAGEDLVTIGANNTKYKVLSLVLDISALTAGSVVTVKMFQQVNGTERKVYSEGFVRQAQVQGSEPDGLWIIAGPVGIHEALRVEVYSSTSESVAIAYDYMLETM